MHLARVWAQAGRGDPCLLHTPATSLPRPLPSQVATEKAQKPLRELGVERSLPCSEWRPGRLAIKTEIRNNLEYSGNKMETSLFCNDT